MLNEGSNVSTIVTSREVADLATDRFVDFVLELAP
jgi:hypothetical protein